jgi:hydrogenase nickel incorporation protein HypA/HybF
MHELSIAQSLLEKILALMDERKAVAVTEVHLRVGALSGVNAEALELAFPIAAEGTPAEGADLRIEHVPAKGTCASCGKQSEFEPGLPLCTACGSTELEISEGRDLLLQRVELDT